MINYNIESIDSALRSAYSVQSSLVINPIEKFGSDHLHLCTFKTPTFKYANYK